MIPPMSGQEFSKLKDNKFVGDGTISFFSKMFNYQELQKQEKGTNYEPYHIFSPFLITRLCFEIGGNKGCNMRNVCSVEGLDIFTNTK